MGLSHLCEHLYTHNIIENPLCKNCGLENESVAHYLLRCPNFTTERAVFLSDLLNVLEGDHIRQLRDNAIVELFLYGHSDFPYQSNLLLIKIKFFEFNFIYGHC